MLEFLGKLALPGAEISAYHEGSKTAFVIGGSELHLVSLVDPSTPTLITTVDLGDDVQSVAVNANGLVALAIGKEGKVGTTQVDEHINGVVQFHAWNGTSLSARGEVAVGVLPD